MKLSFSTIGCPDWTWRDIFTTAKDIGMDGIEVRCIGSELFAPRAAAYRAFADVEVISGFERLYKPERPIYDLMERRLAIPAARLLFLDDTPSNVSAALSYGWQAMIYPPPRSAARDGAKV